MTQRRQATPVSRKPGFGDVQKSTGKGAKPSGVLGNLDDKPGSQKKRGSRKLFMDDVAGKKILLI